MSRLSSHGRAALTFSSPQVRFFKQAEVFFLWVKIALVACSISGLASCATRGKPSLNSSQLREDGSQTTSQATPLFAFWDSGYRGLTEHPDVPGAAQSKGIEGRFLESGNLENSLNQSQEGQFEFHLIHMNPAEYGPNFVFERLDRERFPDLFAHELFQTDSLSEELSQVVQEKMRQATLVLNQKFTRGSGQSPEQFAAEQSRRLKRVKDSVVMRANLAQRMTKKDLVGKSLVDGDSLVEIIQDTGIPFLNIEGTQVTARQLYNSAAVPMSDFIRLGLLITYGGHWTDATITINTDLATYENMLKTADKSLLIYFNPIYQQKTRSETLSQITAGETWWINTTGPNNPMLIDWLSCANTYWTNKVPGTDISRHLLFSKETGTQVDVNTIPEHIRNYLWIYLCWSRVTTAKPEESEKHILALNALDFQNEAPGPYAYLSAHLSQLPMLELTSRLFHAETHPLSSFDFAGLNAVPTAKDAYFRWIDNMKIIKIPGAVSKKLEKVFGRTAPQQNNDIKSKNVFQYIWSKAQASRTRT